MTIPAGTLGVEPEQVELGTEVSPAVLARVDDVVRRAVDRLALWGHDPARRAELVHA